MTDPQDAPQIYLLTPPSFSLADFCPRLETVLDGVDIACLRLAMATQDEDELTRAADALRTICDPRDVPLVVAEHVGLVKKLALDGVHLSGTRGLREARDELGGDAIVGCYCGTSRHDGLIAGEAGADYVSFGPVGAPGALGNGEQAGTELFQWWAQMIEVPLVAEGHLGPEAVATVAPFADFLAIGPEIWREDDALAALKVLTA
ncbi:thiamine phosphate synthase [Paracoccaceae bacterium GXU_MW_L88]